MANGQQFANALLGFGLGAQSGGALIPQFQQIQKDNQRQSLLEQIQGAGGVNTQQGLQLAQQNPTLLQQLQSSEQGQFQAQQQQSQVQEQQRFQGVREEVAGGLLSEAEEDQLIREELIKNPEKGLELVQSLGIADQREAQEVQLDSFGILNASEKRRPKLIIDGIKKAKSSGNQSLVDQLTELAALPKESQDDALKTIITALMPIEDQLAQFKKGGKISARQAEFEKTLGLAGIAPGSQAEKDAALVKLRLKAPAAGSSAQTIADLGTAEQVGASQAIIKGQEEKGKLEAKLELEPQIREAIKLVEAQAAERGETLTDLSRMQAALPGLTDAVSQLKDLSSIATSTFGGRAFDEVAKQSGFGSTKGATARAKFIAIINNQVLPLLKQTFGSAFTEREGDALKASMADPNSSPEEKMAQLESFMAQKQRNIETKQRQLGQQPGQQQQAAPAGFSDQQRSRLEELRRRKSARGG